MDPRTRLSQRGWATVYVIVAILAIAFMVWSDSTWAGPIPAEREIAWLDN